MQAGGEGGLGEDGGGEGGFLAGECGDWEGFGLELGAHGGRVGMDSLSERTRRISASRDADGGGEAGVCVVAISW